MFAIYYYGNCVLEFKDSKYDIFPDLCINSVNDNYVNTYIKGEWTNILKKEIINAINLDNALTDKKINSSINEMIKSFKER